MFKKIKRRRYDESVEKVYEADKKYSVVIAYGSNGNYSFSGSCACSCGRLDREGNGNRLCRQA